MSEFLRDYHLPSVIIALILVCQLSIYFFYLYIKVRKEKLELNRLLLGFSLLYGFTMTSFLFRDISNYYVEDQAIKGIVNIITIIGIMIGTLSYHFIISKNAFAPIINPNITKTIILLIFIIGSFLLLVSDAFIRDMISLLIITLVSVNLIVFNKRLFDLTTGDIKKRLSFILIGQIIMYSYIIMNFIILLTQLINELLLLFLTVGLICGQTIILFGIYQFPAFLEFDWKHNLIKMYIINHKDYTELYSYEFIDIPENPGDNHSSAEKIFTRGIVGIDQIVSSITHTENKRIKKIKQEDVHIILDYGEEPIPLIYALIVFKEMNSTQYFLKKVSHKFDKFYKHILLDLDAVKGKEEYIFSTFNDKLIKLLE